jgi:hypothetical protein
MTRLSFAARTVVAAFAGLLVLASYLPIAELAARVMA